MDNRETRYNPHPPACTCVDCVNERLGLIKQSKRSRKHIESQQPEYRPPTNQKVLTILRKLGLNLLVLITLVLLIWSSAKAFSHKWAPTMGSISVVIALILFILSCILFNNRKYRKPSMKLTVFCLILLFLIVAFSSVEPMNSYKNTLLDKAADVFSQINAQLTSAITAPTLSPQNTKEREPSINSATTIDKVINSVKSFVVGDVDVGHYATIFNQYRQSKGQAPLEFTNDLNRIVTLRLAEIKIDFSHNSPGGHTRYLAENIVEGVYTNLGALTCWEGSPGHNANMLDSSYKYTGYAAGDGHAVQVFTEWPIINGKPQLPPGWYFP